MSKSARFGGVTVQFNEDGTLFIYQPDSSRVMSEDLAGDLIDFLVLNYEPMQTLAEDTEADALAKIAQSTVPAGVINTGGGVHEQEADEALAPSAELVEDLESVHTFTLPENPSLKELQDVCAAFGLPTYGTKTQIIERLKKRGITGPGLDGD